MGMKIAHSPDKQERLEASPTAPLTALCPDCGGPVRLRSRRQMSGVKSYFWRHLANRNHDCPGRARPRNVYQ